MKAAARINTQARRFDIRLAASTMDKNTKVALEVIKDPASSDAHRYQAGRLLEVTELNLTSAVQAYLALL